MLGRSTGAWPTSAPVTGYWNVAFGGGFVTFTVPVASPARLVLSVTVTVTVWSWVRAWKIGAPLYVVSAGYTSDCGEIVPGAFSTNEVSALPSPQSTLIVHELPVASANDP